VAPSSSLVRLHVQTNRQAASVYQITPEMFHARAAASPWRDRVAESFGHEPDHLDAALADAEVLFVHGRLDLGRLSERAPRLKWIQSTGAGVDRLLPQVPEGIVVTTTSGIHAVKGGEYAMTALLMLNHRVPHFVTAQRASRWDQAFSDPIAGKTVLVIGAGSIGTAAARLARQFGMRVLGVSRSGQPNPAVDRMYRPADLPTLLPQADFVLVILPLTDETRGLLDRAALDLLPRHAGVVNLGRGAVIDNDALAEKLRRGELGGAVLDVYPAEPLPPSSPLWSTPNLIMSPHCAVDPGSYAAFALDHFLDNLQRYVIGQPLANVVDRSLGY